MMTFSTDRTKIRFFIIRLLLFRSFYWWKIFNDKEYSGCPQMTQGLTRVQVFRNRYDRNGFDI